MKSRFWRWDGRAVSWWIMAVAAFWLAGPTVFADDEDPEGGWRLMEGWGNGSGGWVKRLTSGNAHHTEGQVVPFRFAARLRAGSRHLFTLRWDFTRPPTGHFFDSAADYDATEVVADPVEGLGEFGASMSTAFPVDPTLPVGARREAVMTSYGLQRVYLGPVVNQGDYKFLQGRLTVEGSEGWRTVVLAWGVQLADEAVWGPGQGASHWPASLGSVRLRLDREAEMGVAVMRDVVSAVDTVPPELSCPEAIEVVEEADRCGAAVDFAVSAWDEVSEEVTVECVPPSGSLFPVGETWVTCTARDAAGNEATCHFPVNVLPAANLSWPWARPLELTEDPANPGWRHAVATECLGGLDESRWYKFRVAPESSLVVTLTDLPEDYDLVVFRDIAAAYEELTSEPDLAVLNAEFAPDAFAPAQFSADALSPAAFSPAAFSPAAFSPAQFSPAQFSPAAFSPAAFSPAAFSPDAWAPAQFSPAQFSPAAFSPAQFSPAQFSPAQFSPAAFSAAQVQSVLGVSAFDGTAGEGLLLRTWNNTGDFYVRVKGRNGVFQPGAPFRLEVFLSPSECGDLELQPPSDLPAGPPAVAGGYRTLILTDLSRLPDDGGLATLSDRLAALAARPEVLGMIVDLAADPRAAFFQAQADAKFGCPTAKNLAAQAIKEVVDAWAALNPLENLVLVGGDAVIPFFRYPDEALLGPEQNYIPPVRDATASQAALRMNYFLSQDQYGAACVLNRRTGVLPIPQLGIGRLGETPTEIVLLLDAYLETVDGVVAAPSSALVTGYDFLTDSASAIRDELSAAMGGPVDTLLVPADQPPSAGWTATDLRAALFGTRHDVAFLAGHFSAFSALAADFTTTVAAAELLTAPADFKNALIYSGGCHSGYGAVDLDGISGVTPEPDWAQACARRQATLLAGTGYQYGDTDFIEYSERLYLEFTRQLRTGSGPVSVGRALAEAKRRYLAALPVLRPLHEKSLLQATLYGLPMLSLDFGGARLAPVAPGSIVEGTVAESKVPGSVLGLAHADLEVVPTLTPRTLALNDAEGTPVALASYLEGADGTLVNPAEPILPLEARDVGVAGVVLRGVGFRGGQYEDVAPVLPLTGAPATEIRGVHSTFLSASFFPVQPWFVNYFGSLCTAGDTGTRLMTIPAQFRVDDPASGQGTMRRFSALQFRLFYSGNLETYVEDGLPSTPGRSGPPSLSDVLCSVEDGVLHFRARAVGNPAAGMQAVWVTYTAVAGPWHGQWRSLDLGQNSDDSTLWEGVLPLDEGVNPGEVRFLVQAVNGIGLVAMNTRRGAFHIPDWYEGFTTVGSEAVQMLIVSAPKQVTYGGNLTVRALLTKVSGPLPGRVVQFKIGDQLALGITGEDGMAQSTFRVATRPGTYGLRATFGGEPGYQPGSASVSVEIRAAATRLELGPENELTQLLDGEAIHALLTDAAGNPLVERSVLFALRGPKATVFRTSITDLFGRARLGRVAVPAGSYSLEAYFGSRQVLEVEGGSTAIDLRDPQYEASFDQVTVQAGGGR